jgi:DNA-directed RNA polymerase II subunit RPB2
VINSFFADKGLVRQQLESFNEFVENSMQEIVEERGKLVLDQYPQYNNEDDTVMVSAARDLGNRRPGKSGR